MNLACASSLPKAPVPAHFRTWHSRVCCTLHPVATCLELICGANKLRAVHTHAGEASMDAGTARHQHGRHSCGVVCMRTTPSVAVHASLEHMQVRHRQGPSLSSLDLSYETGTHRARSMANRHARRSQCMDDSAKKLGRAPQSAVMWRVHARNVRCMSVRQGGRTTAK